MREIHLLGKRFSIRIQQVEAFIRGESSRIKRIENIGHKKLRIPLGFGKINFFRKLPFKHLSKRGLPFLRNLVPVQSLHKHHMYADFLPEFPHAFVAVIFWKDIPVLFDIRQVIIATDEFLKVRFKLSAFPVKQAVSGFNDKPDILQKRLFIRVFFTDLTKPAHALHNPVRFRHGLFTERSLRGKIGIIGKCETAFPFFKTVALLSVTAGKHTEHRRLHDFVEKGILKITKCAFLQCLGFLIGGFLFSGSVGKNHRMNSLIHFRMIFTNQGGLPHKMLRPPLLRIGGKEFLFFHVNGVHTDQIVFVEFGYGLRHSFIPLLHHFFLSLL